MANSREENFERLVSFLEADARPRGWEGEFSALLAAAFEAELVSILDLNRATQTLQFRWSMDIAPADWSAFRFRLGEGICGAAALLRKTITSHHPAANDAAASRVEHRTGKPIMSLLASPIVRGGRCLGVLEILNKKSGSFDEGDQRLSRLCAALCAAKMDGPEAEAANRKKYSSSRRKEPGSDPRIVSSCVAMEEALLLALKAAQADLPVLVLGETGTGKELIAQRVHFASPRSSAPLVTINCAALTDTLLESELFGHVRGAFTGANRDRRGKLEEAEGGTVFLDEVGEMSPACQAKLLRALDYGEISPVGSNETRKVNFRVVAATNRPLAQLALQGRFRPDLYYRLNGIQIELPPLRERDGDIELLSSHFLAQSAARNAASPRGFTEEALALMKSYPWPGNVRELRHAIEHAIVVASGELIGRRDLPGQIGKSERTEPAQLSGMGSRLRQNEGPQTENGEARRILAALSSTSYPGSGRWNLARAARSLGMNRKTLEYKVFHIYGFKREGS